MESLHEYEWLDGRYRLKNKIGQGSFGEVWRVYDTQFNTEMAAKICSSNDEKNKIDFEKEYKTTKRLNHPNLVCPMNFGVFGERLFIIMPYCPSSASKMIGCCTDRMVWEFFRDISHGLAYLHKKGVVHHDIKPDNILIDENNRFKISDFGVSTQFGDSSHKGDEALKGGSEGYMGPEMFKPDAESIKATDIWALGATAYEMLSGELPFYGIGGRAQNGGAMLNEIHHHVSSNLMQLVRDCMAKETWDRPTASEIAEYTQILFDESSDHPYWDEYFRRVRKKVPLPVWEPEPESQPMFEPERYPSYKPVKKRKLWWISAVAAAVAGIVIVLWMMTDSHHHQSPDTNSYSFMSNNINPVETYNQPAPVQATYLKVNGSDIPQQLKVGNSESSITIEVETDGLDYSIKIPDNCIWITQAAKTSKSFVLYFTDNATANTRNSTIKVTSGTLTAELPISQEPVRAKAPDSNLTPTQTTHNPEQSSGNKPKKKKNPSQQPSSSNEPEKKHDPIDIPISRLKPVLY